MTITRQKEQSATAAAEQRQGRVNGFRVVEEAASLHGLHVTEEEYWENYYEKSDVSYEWNNGILEEKPVPDYRRVTMYGWFQQLLHSYLETNPVGKMLFLEVGFRLALADKTTIRKPDLFVVRNDNPISLLETDMSYKGICDLCVESLSISTKEEIERDTVVKKQEYAEVGVREYYILDPDDKTAFYRLGYGGIYATIPEAEEGVIHSEVLPGFRFRVDDLFAMPALETLVEDPVYRPFVLLQYQAAKHEVEIAKERADVAEERAYVAEERADAAEQRATDAEIQAAQERARADRLAAMLRQLGIEEE